jgi:hypothetical protein
MVGRIIIGFIAGMLAVLIIHQPLILLMGNLGLLPPTAKAYNMAALPNAPVVIANALKGFGLAGWPVLFNNLFWGGLLGTLFGLISGKLPGGMMIIKGLIFGLLVLVFSNWLLVPLLKSTPIFAGFVPLRMAVGAAISAGFGIGVGLFYGLLRRREA